MKDNEFKKFDLIIYVPEWWKSNQRNNKVEKKNVRTKGKVELKLYEH